MNIKEELKNKSIEIEGKVKIVYLSDALASIDKIVEEIDKMMNNGTLLNLYDTHTILLTLKSKITG